MTILAALAAATATAALSINARPSWADERLTYARWLLLLLASTIVGTLVGSINSHVTHAAMFAAFTVAGIITTVTDLLYWKIPRGVQHAALGVAAVTFAANGVLWFIKPEYSTFGSDLFGVIPGVLFVVLLTGLVVSVPSLRGSVGGGDIKMMLLLGLTSTIEVLLWSYVLALPLSILLYMFHAVSGANRSGDRKRKVAYGPPLSVAAIVAMTAASVTGIA